MATIKVLQKFSQEQFKAIISKIKEPGEGMLIVKDTKGNPLSNEDILGKVHNAFNLGKKVEAQVVVAAEPKGEVFQYLFTQLNGHYYLVRKEGKRS